MERKRHYFIYIFITVIVIIGVGVWYFTLRYDATSPYLKVAFLDVGQGDSIYIEAPNGTQMLIDGGPDDAVLARLGEVMPWGDSSLDVVLATHSDADHISGLPSVIEQYHVPMIIENGASSKTKIFNRLEDTVVKNNVKKIIARRGMHIMLDPERNIYFDVLFPDRDVSGFKETNDGSIVGKLVYGTESFMLTGDATTYTENLIMQNESSDTLHSTILKLGHHGSHTSSGILWLEKVHPETAIISAGLHNRYGHPHKDILDRLAELHIPYLSTYDKGTIMLKTDGVILSY